MKWVRTANPQVWEASEGRHHAMAERSPFGEGGFIARVYVVPAQIPMFGQAEPEPVQGMARWGLDAEAALRQVIRRFDPEAELPPREGGLATLYQAEGQWRCKK